MKIKFLKYFKFHLIFIFYICFYPLAFSEDNGPEQLIIKIYHDYAWVAVIGDQWKGEGISSQKLPVLQKYFDYRLAALLEKDNESPLKNPQTASIARPHLRFWRAGTASFHYSTYWFLAVFAHAYTPSCRRAIACR
ncbi:hypothetical protein [Xanthomonas oryzae]|uniref:hypothetical protein n=1 Tax=Xanthomonas oryzae TaxID=347 RepID=UPI0011BF5C56|nr:hypothetical protein [Xanthomonas oryzae]